MRAWGWCAFAYMLVACSRPAQNATPQPSPPAVPPAPTQSADPPPPPRAAAPPPAPIDPCDTGNLVLFVSPQEPIRGAPLRVVAVFDHPIDAELAIAGPDHAPVVTTRDRQGGPPYFLFAQIDSPKASAYQASFSRDPSCNVTPATKSIRLRAGPPPPPALPETGLWPTRTMWSRSTENLYSAWVQKLFDAPLDQQPSWPALDQVLRDRSRNFLFDHLGAAEDELEIPVRPDCADLPYFLRAYFAFKLRLPFGWSDCTRGEGGSPPTCSDFKTNEDPPGKEITKELTRLLATDPLAKPPPHRVAPAVALFAAFLHTTLADATQSGAGRTLADDEESDYAPIALSIETLRPGTIFADPYGHVLVVARRVPQTADAGGIMLAVDGQPDGTVGRKRFWRGNFLFALDPALGSAGFKRFRPLARDPATSALRRLRNKEISAFSVEQYQAGVDGFYDRMEDVLSPAPIEPAKALVDVVQALEEQVRTRVGSVDNGRKFLDAGRPPAEMPDGAELFETKGDWEDYSTPSRDLRLLIAIDVLNGFSARVGRRPERYAMPPGKNVGAVRAELDASLARELRARHFTYTRSDGSSWELSLEDVVRRSLALEMAYNPNDCVELRWGAPLASQESTTCSHRAPTEQIAKMELDRSWFHERRRPAR